GADQEKLDEPRNDEACERLCEAAV
ncbi:hypothetical protein EVA_10552, partial [gut metagenome]